jgi:hypothetical protein
VTVVVDDGDGSSDGADPPLALPALFGPQLAM